MTDNIDDNEIDKQYAQRYSHLDLFSSADCKL